MTTPAAAVATREPKTLRDHLKSPAFKASIADSMPKHLKPERFISVALAALTKTPKLMDVTQESMFAAFRQLSSLGLEPDGRRAHLIPFGNQVQLIIDYKGLVELIYRSGEVTKLHADVVCQNDIFDYNLGEIQRHVIDFKARDGRGEVYAVYALAVMKSGVTKCEVMSVQDVEDIRKRSKNANNGPWKTDWAEMAKKTVFRRLSKWLPLSPDVRDAAETDDENVIVDTTPARQRGPVQLGTVEPVQQIAAPLDEADQIELIRAGKKIIEEAGLDVIDLQDQAFERGWWSGDKVQTVSALPLEAYQFIVVNAKAVVETVAKISQ